VHPSHEVEVDLEPLNLEDGCTAVCDAAAFVAALLAGGEARWREVVELCEASGTSRPAALPRATQVSWMPYPGGDLDRIAVVFLDPRSGWGNVVATRRG
jgi:hypothetical protein